METNLLEMQRNKGHIHQTVASRLKPANELIGYGMANGPPHAAAAQSVMDSLSQSISE